MKEHTGELGAIAHLWFECPVARLGDAPFGYIINVFTSRVNVGFFRGATLPDPDGLLQGTGKFMRHLDNCARFYEQITAILRINRRRRTAGIP